MTEDNRSEKRQNDDNISKTFEPSTAENQNGEDLNKIFNIHESSTVGNQCGDNLENISKSRDPLTEKNERVEDLKKLSRSHESSTKKNKRVKDLERISIAREPIHESGEPSDGDSKRARRPVYLDAKKSKWPPWVLAIIVFFLMMAGLFIVVPGLVGRVPESPPPVETLSSSSGELPDHPADAVIAASFAPILASPDLKAPRVADALFNEPCVILETQGALWFKIRLEDGVEGYVRRDLLAAGTRSVNPAGAIARVLVVDTCKRIMSHAYQGTLLTEAPMGSIFFADYRRGDLFRVIMPGGGSGWISGSGVLTGPVSEPLMTEDDPQTVFASTVRRFFRTPYVPSGATMQGMSPEGAIFVASRLIGMDLTRTTEGLLNAGESLTIPKIDGIPDLSVFREGDLLFYRVDGREDYALAVCVQDHQLLMTLPNRTTLRLIDLVAPEALQMASKIEVARRLFP
ncbi:MAG: SH3 domain-containing protein [Clostridiaceae bacterium]|jgi:hypothetical protein|nr:SH3 domain-containing protein [Clostridiaceae bacterium]